MEKNMTKKAMIDQNTVENQVDLINTAKFLLDKITYESPVDENASNLAHAVDLLVVAQNL